MSEHPEQRRHTPEAPAQQRRFLHRQVPVGIAGGLALLAIFVGVVLASSPWDFALYEFGRLWYWALLLAAGFATQLGLFTFIRARIRERSGAATAGVAASGAVSTGSMVACCAHGVANILPFLGLSAAAVFLARYQIPLILLGVFSSLVGITVMLGTIKRHDLAEGNTLLATITRYDMNRARNIAIVLGTAVLASVFLSAALAEAGTGTIANLPARTDGRNMVTVQVQPEDIVPGQPLRFKISLNTHVVELNYDLAAISTLTDGQGRTLKPTAWEGAGPGGHHRSGTLVFPALGPDAASLRLVIKGVADVPERVFEWSLK